MMHVVRSGETLSAIANQHGTSVTTLVRLNPAISDPNRIKVGQSINLPAANPRQHCTVGQIQSQSDCAPEPFELAFYWNDQVQERNAIYTEIFGSGMNFRLRSIFDRNNEHLGTTVLPGEIVIVSNMPVTAQDRERLERLKNEARLASSGIQQLAPEEATTVKRHIEIFDHAAAGDNASLPSAALGVLSATAAHRLKDVSTVLESLNAAYVEELTRNPAARRLSPEFLATRGQLFSELDHALNRVTMSTMNIRQYDKVKHTLGLSTKSILYNASEILDRGQVPQLGRRIQTISAWSKGAKLFGWFGIAIDGGVRLNTTVEACSAGREEQCSMVKYQQVSGFVGGAGGGAVGGAALGKMAAAGSTVVALAFGVTLGAPVIAVIAVTGVAVGVYAGGSMGGSIGESAGQMVYEWRSAE
ncbi:LysM peptidoglycan-binding domain-containing protein [Halopseudomonas pelagia]|uniref:LysM domain-containing protein n=1 Tax=Halopseudomonas pelagia TaxID=553151 RepID=A0AA91U5L2_9GAMM|nr:LysM domain-containing protein [Halopseudomonas pelagia]PCD00784.1 peptidoglycan-binding protein [Halopseudomonas pelagia]QFY58074.1 LysM domain-containing protein [Halopseudomonas pelagia]